MLLLLTLMGLSQVALPAMLPVVHTVPIKEGSQLRRRERPWVSRRYSERDSRSMCFSLATNVCIQCLEFALPLYGTQSWRNCDMPHSFNCLIVAGKCGRLVASRFCGAHWMTHERRAWLSKIHCSDLSAFVSIFVTKPPFSQAGSREIKAHCR